MSANPVAAHKANGLKFGFLGFISAAILAAVLYFQGGAGGLDKAIKAVETANNTTYVNTVRSLDICDNLAKIKDLTEEQRKAIDDLKYTFGKSKENTDQLALVIQVYLDKTYIYPPTDTSSGDAGVTK